MSDQNKTIPTSSTISDPQEIVDNMLGSVGNSNELQPTADGPVKQADSPSVVMGDDTPLAFMGGISTTPINAGETSESRNTVPSQQPTGSNQIDNADFVPSFRSKGKLSIVFGGILLLIASVGGGIWGYQQYIIKNSQPASIAEVDETGVGRFLRAHGAIACGSLSDNKEVPVIGDTMTFTCANGNDYYPPIYHFRYSINSGAWKDLTSTDNTASLVINTCGNYVVQCRVCTPQERLPSTTMYNCAPIWTGATIQ